MRVGEADGKGSPVNVVRTLKVTVLKKLPSCLEFPHQ